MTVMRVSSVWASAATLCGACVDYKGEKHAKHAFTQGMLVKIFQGLPNLCWSKSDLTQENIAILQHERPDVTFVQNEQVEQCHMSASEEQQVGSSDSSLLPWFVPSSWPSVSTSNASSKWSEMAVRRGTRRRLVGLWGNGTGDAIVVVIHVRNLDLWQALAGSTTLYFIIILMLY